MPASAQHKSTTIKATETPRTLPGAPLKKESEGGQEASPLFQWLSLFLVCHFQRDVIETDLVYVEYLFSSFFLEGHVQIHPSISHYFTCLLFSWKSVVQNYMLFLIEN